MCPLALVCALSAGALRRWDEPAAPARPRLASLSKLRGGADDAELAESLENLKGLLARLKTLRAEPPPAEGPRLVEPQVGDRVRVRPGVAEPKYEWGGATPSSVGTLTWFEGDRCLVDFPQQSRWIGLLSEMERVGDAAGQPAVGDTVRVRRNVTKLAYGWGHSVNHDSVGEVKPPRVTTRA